jgi:hypothetical protein
MRSTLRKYSWKAALIGVGGGPDQEAADCLVSTRSSRQRKPGAASAPSATGGSIVDAAKAGIIREPADIIKHSVGPASGCSGAAQQVYQGCGIGRIHRHTHSARGAACDVISHRSQENADLVERGESPAVCNVTAVSQ